MADKQFKASLVQHEWVVTEVFDITAKDEKAAQAEADKIINSKDLKGKEYKVEVSEVAPPEPPEPTSPSAPAPEPVER